MYDPFLANVLAGYASFEGSLGCHGAHGPEAGDVMVGDAGSPGWLSSFVSSPHIISPRAQQQH